LPRLCGFPLPDHGDRRLNRSAESSLRVGLPLEFCPANPSRLPQRTGSSLGLCFPSAHQGPEVHLPRGFQASLSSALRVWSPSRRFTPSEPVPALFRTGGAHGIPPFGAFPSREVSTASPPLTNPHAVLPTNTVVTEATTRPSQPRLLGFGPRKSPLRPACV